MKTASGKSTAPYRLTDSHCHLDFDNLYGELDSVIFRAKDAGIHRMVSIATTLESVPKVAAIAEHYTGVFFAAGLHPMKVADQGLPNIETLIEISNHPKCVGIGETGLDYHYTKESAAIQAESLKQHILVAQETALPLIIHARDADEDMATLLKQSFQHKPYSCVMHCFSSGKALAHAALDLGFYLSISGIAAFPRSEALRDIFASAPRERLLIETDAPYLAPPPYRGKRNEPAYLRHTAERLAEALEMSFADFAALTEENFERLFKKAA